MGPLAGCYKSGNCIWLRVSLSLSQHVSRPAAPQLSGGGPWPGARQGGLRGRVQVRGGLLLRPQRDGVRAQGGADLHAPAAESLHHCA